MWRSSWTAVSGMAARSTRHGPRRTPNGGERRSSRIAPGTVRPISASRRQGGSPSASGRTNVQRTLRTASWPWLKRGAAALVWPVDPRLDGVQATPTRGATAFARCRACCLTAVYETHCRLGRADRLCGSPTPQVESGCPKRTSSYFFGNSFLSQAWTAVTSGMPCFFRMLTMSAAATTTIGCWSSRISV